MFHYIIHINLGICKSRCIRDHTVSLLEQPNYPSVAHDILLLVLLFYIHLQVDLKSIFVGSSWGPS